MTSCLCRRAKYIGFSACLSFQCNSVHHVFVYFTLCLLIFLLLLCLSPLSLSVREPIVSAHSFLCTQISSSVSCPILSIHNRDVCYLNRQFTVSLDNTHNLPPSRSLCLISDHYPLHASLSWFSSSSKSTYCFEYSEIFHSVFVLTRLLWEIWFITLHLHL